MGFLCGAIIVPGIYEDTIRQIYPTGNEFGVLQIYSLSFNDFRLHFGANLATLAVTAFIINCHGVMCDAIIVPGIC